MVGEESELARAAAILTEALQVAGLEGLVVRTDPARMTATLELGSIGEMESLAIRLIPGHRPE